MHTLIISGGTIDTDFALDLLKKEKYDHIIGVDGALKFCKEQNIVPTRIVGDFDTLDPEILTWYQTHTQIEIRPVSYTHLAAPYTGAGADVENR